MRKLLNLPYKIPNVNEILANPQSYLDFVNNLVWRENQAVHFDGKQFVYVQKFLYEIFRRYFPSESTIINYIDLDFLSKFFHKKYGVSLTLDVEYLPYDYDKYQQCDLSKAPASIDLKSGRISFRYPVIFSLIFEKFFYFVFTNKDVINDINQYPDIILLIILFLLDHELGHLFFSPSEDQLNQVLTKFLSNNPGLTNFSFDTLHRISNFVEDMYIEDKFKATVYPNDPSIHLVYDIGRYFMRG